MTTISPGPDALHLLARASGQAYFGEPVTQLEHALQSAKLAADAGADDETILAALLHDIGHVLEGEVDDELGVIDHDEVGLRWLREHGYGERLVLLVGGHVDAKRYLVATNPGYAARLSPASTATLARQGGPMNASEVDAFASHPLHREMLRLRSWDEQAKVPGLAVPDLDSYRALHEAYLRREAR